MGTIYIQRCDDVAVDLFDKFKISVQSIESLSEPKETKLGDSKASYNLVVRIAISSNQMNLLSQFTNYISSRLRGQYDKNLRGESKDGTFQLIDVDSTKGYRLSYVNMIDPGIKDGKNKVLDLLFMDETPQATLVQLGMLCFDNVGYDVYLSDGTFLRNQKNCIVPNVTDWALVISADDNPYEKRTVFSGAIMEDSQFIKQEGDGFTISARIVHKGIGYTIKSYDRGATWFMLTPLYENIHTSPNMTVKEICGTKVCYYSREMLQELTLPEGFRLPTLKDMLNLDGCLGALDCMGDFYNEKTLYGFVEYLKLRNSYARSAFWALDAKGEICAVQFVEKGNRIVCERMNVEDSAFLPVIGISK